MNSKILKKFKIPDKPGVYFFLRGKGILYIGKATSLRDRVKSYLVKDLSATRGPLIRDMFFKANSIKWTETDSVLEALILEANLIKKHQPIYNTKEKSDKSFNYVCITKEELPKIIVKRGKEIEKQTDFKNIFGPFPNSSQLKEALKIIRFIFPFLDDKSKNHYKFYRQVNLIPDILTKEGISIYKNNIRKLELFFEGKKRKILKDLEKEMKIVAKIQKFERAGEIKRQLFALKHINDVALLKNDHSSKSSFYSGPRISGSLSQPDHSQKLLLLPLKRIEAYDIAHMSGKNMVGVMVVLEDGELNKNEYRRFKIKTHTKANDIGALVEVLERRFTHREWKKPDLIVVDGGIAQLRVASRTLKELKINISAVSVVKDERHKPKAVLGNAEFIKIHKSAIILANNEAHRFAINYHKNLRDKSFLK